MSNEKIYKVDIKLVVISQDYLLVALNKNKINLLDSLRIINQVNKLYKTVEYDDIKILAGNILNSKK